MELFTKNEITLNNLRLLYEQYGYSRFKMSKFEEYDLYLRYKKFLSTSNIITFTDLSGKLYALKPDITLSIAKSVKDGEEKKVYYTENVYRAARGSDEYKELTQLGLEYMGEVDGYIQGEVILLAALSLGNIDPDYILDISHMGFITGLFDHAGLDETMQERMLDHLGRKETHAITAYCDKLGLDGAVKDAFATLSEVYGSFDKTLAAVSGIAFTDKMKSALSELEEIHRFLEAAGQGDKLNLDFSIVNDLGYYNGAIFKGYVHGVPESVLSGGRYDKLMQKLGSASQAIGFAVNVDLLELYEKYDKSSDVDVVLLYAEDSDPVAVSRAVSSYTELGASVKAVKAIPDSLKYKKLALFDSEGVTEKDGNA